jgi:hypothetical protein
MLLQDEIHDQDLLSRLLIDNTHVQPNYLIVGHSARLEVRKLIQTQVSTFTKRANAGQQCLKKIDRKGMWHFIIVVA